MDILSLLDKIIVKEDLNSIKSDVLNIINNLNGNEKHFVYILNGEEQTVQKDLLQRELNQILETRTVERTKYYLNRLIKSLVEQKTGKINDINLNRWKEYDDIITDSLWLIDKRDKSGAHKADYWGNFIPQIPNQLLRRYTKKGEWVLDPFLGCGTTLIECKRLGRNGVGIELSNITATRAKKNIAKEENHTKVKTSVQTGNSFSFKYENLLKKLKLKSFQFMVYHPPYWDIIKFSNKKDDLSNADSVNEFLNMFGKVIDKTLPLLDKGRYCAVVIGDKYSGGEWIPLGFYTMMEFAKRGLKLKSILVKNFDQTLAKRNQKELWRYRALAGGFYIFKHEYIFLFRK